MKIMLRTLQILLLAALNPPEIHAAWLRASRIYGVTTTTTVTTAISKWPQESVALVTQVTTAKVTTTAKPAAPKAATTAKPAVPPAAPKAKPPPAAPKTKGPKAAAPAPKKMPAVPLATTASPPAGTPPTPQPCPNAGNATNITVTPCPSPFNNTGALDSMKNMAQLAGGAAQASLQAVLESQRPERTSPQANSAEKLAEAAQQTMSASFKLAREAADSAKRSKQTIKKVNKVIRKGVEAYASAINRMQIPPPRIMHPR